MKVEVLSFKGKKTQPLEISDQIFKISPNPQLISQVARGILANQRRPIAHTKDRGEVAGGGRKPFRQKGTGNARAGSIRSPLWRGGGTVFGPQKFRHFAKRIPQKMREKALKMALSVKVKSGKLIVVSHFDFPGISCQQMQDFLEKLPIEEGKILLVLKETHPNLELSVANLPYMKTVLSSGLNLIDLLNYDYLLTDKIGLQAIENKWKS